MCQKKTEHDWMDYSVDISMLRAHKPGEPMPRLGRTEEPVKKPVEPRKEKPVETSTDKEQQGEHACQRILDYWLGFMDEHDRQPTTREAKAALHVSNDTLARHLEKLRKKGKLPPSRKPGHMKTTDEDYVNPIRQIERYVQIIDDFATETIRIRHTMYEAIKDNPDFLFADHNLLNDLLNIRRGMASLLKALKEGAIDK